MLQNGASLEEIMQKCPQLSINEIQEAIKQWKSFSNSNTFNTLQQAYTEKGKIEKAYKSINILKINPNDAIEHFILGNVYTEKGELVKAIESYIKALKINPKYVDAHYSLGTVYYKLGKLKKAIRCYKKALLINPQFAEAYNNLGNIYTDIKEFKKAIKSYKNALKINPNFSEAYFNLGNVFADIEEYDKAIESYENALAINFYYTEAHNNLGILYIKMKKYNEARIKFIEYICLFPENWRGYFFLAEIYSIFKQKEEAIKFLQIAKEKNPEIIMYKNDEPFNFLRESVEFKKIMKNDI